MRQKVITWALKTALPFLGVQAIEELIKILEKQKAKLEEKP